MRAGMLACAAVFVASCKSDTDTPPAAPKAPTPWSVSQRAVRDIHGRTVLFRGATLAGAHKYAPYVSDFGPADYSRLREIYGFNQIRYLMTWAAVEPEKGVYNEQFLDEVVKRLGWAKDAGLDVILDMHQDLYGEGFLGGDGAPKWTCTEDRYKAFKPTIPWFFGAMDPNLAACTDQLYREGEVRTHFIDMWRHVAKRLAGLDIIVGFEPLNEPHWGSYSILGFEEEVLAPFYMDVIKAVREEAPQWLAFVEPGSSSNVGYASTLPKLPVENVVFAPHAYDNEAESNNGFDNVRRDAFIGRFKTLRDEANALDAALWVGEYGGGGPTVVPYMDAAYDGGAAVAAGMSYWAYDKNTVGYGLVNDDNTVKEDVADVVGRPYPSRIAGDLTSFGYDETKKELTVHFVPNRKITAPTEIVVPVRMAPNGVDVTCGGCETEVTPGLIRLKTAPPGADKAPVDVTVRAK